MHNAITVFVVACLNTRATLTLVVGQNAFIAVNVLETKLVLGTNVWILALVLAAKMPSALFTTTYRCVPVPQVLQEIRLFFVRKLKVLIGVEKN